ncbi:MAG: aspartate/glutamate racemase family protein [Ancalomicrobiaceae bacterium]|nr:aspartate/glutamate racemase family protein [Ancalomicrobiaceae bacterium]
MLRLILINPNTNPATTAMMRAIAERAAPQGTTVAGVTVSRGASLITDADELAAAAEAVIELAPALAEESVDGAIVSAFGDPGATQLARTLPFPVTGIGEAAFAEATADGRRFAVVTTTPRLVDSIAALAVAHGHGRQFLGVGLTDGDPAVLTYQPEALVEALGLACERAIADWRAEAIVIGGGPLGEAAAELVGRIGVPVIAPIPAAVRLAVRRVGKVCS